MCGRFTQRLSSADFARIFGARDLLESAGERYNVAPSQRVAVVAEREEERVLEPMRWGLVPGWAKSPLAGKHPINARAETVAASPLFRHAFRATRCLVPADGFYEWQRLPDGRRQPHYISAPNDQPLAFAGLWSAWSERTSEAPALLTCAILTTTPNETMATIHDRMPVILTPEAWGLWLDRQSDPSELQGLLRPYSGDLRLYPVAPLVNSVRQQGPALIAPLLRE